MLQVWKNSRFGARAGLILGVILSTMAIVGLTSFTSAQDGQDCDDNAVIRCGVTDLAHLQEKYRENEQGNTQLIFKEFGIDNEAEMNGMVEGRVTGDNRVFVGDREVATNAFTAGRQNMSNEAGSSTAIAGGAAYRRPPSVSFTNPDGSLRALVKMDGERFQFAVILSCGNPVTATPVRRPAQPTGGGGAAVQPKPNFTITKDVRIEGQTAWVQNATARQGDHLEFRIIIRNTGQTDLRNMLLRDVAPAGTTLEAGSLTLGGQAQTGLESMFTAQGVLIALLAKGQQVEILFHQIVDSSTQACNTRLRNVAYARIEDGTEKQDDATATIACPATVTPAVTTSQPAATTPVAQPAAAASAPAAKGTTTTIPDTGIGGLLGPFTLFSIAGLLLHSTLIGSRRL